jgi:hypothetical protein
MKIRSVGADLFHVDVQTDMTKVIVAFRNFAKEKKVTNIHILEEHREHSWSDLKCFSV